MPRYKVRCYASGVWDQVPPIEVHARTMREAAEIVCGQHLVGDVAGDIRLRAAVWHAGTIPIAAHFHTPSDSALTVARPPVPPGVIAPMPLLMSAMPALQPIVQAAERHPFAEMPGLRIRIYREQECRAAGRCRKPG